jgi:mannose-6-phosphate isomerase
MNENQIPTLISRSTKENRKTYLVKYNTQTFEIHEELSEKGNTHTFIVLSMGKPPTDAEENLLVVFIKRLTENEETEAGVEIHDAGMMPKTEKPWGSETRISSFPHYVLKRIRITAGKRTSLQYHNEKYETLIFTSGIAVVEYRNKNGNMMSMEATRNTIIEFPPHSPHRVQAITDIEYFEASTPELANDTIRMEDDYGRKTEAKQ